MDELFVCLEPSKGFQADISNGYKLWVTKLGKNKSYSLPIKAPENDYFKQIGLIKDVDKFKKILGYRER